MSVTIFVDTNVFVYARDAHERHKQPTAMQWLETLWSEQRGRTSMQVLAEYYVTVTRKLRPGLTATEAWDDVRALLAWSPQEIDRELLLQAHEIEQRYRLSWWDSMIIAAAQLQGCTQLLSEDLQDGATYGSVAVCNPFMTRVAEERAPYSAKPMAVARHKARGRPRRKA